MAKIAVSAATYWIDRPYEYSVPEELAEKARPGCRVHVPFSAGNRTSEGIILALSDTGKRDKLKSIKAVLDDEPVLSAQQLKLALFMRERFFCTVYDAVKAILPAGLWFDSEGNRRVKDKTVEYASLLIPGEDAALLAEQKRVKAPQQGNLLRELAVFGRIPVRELLLFTDCRRPSLMALVNAGLVELNKEEAFRRPEFYARPEKDLPVLNSEQKAVFEGLNAQRKKGAGAALLQGVTGSGKTSVYIHLISEVLKEGKSAILLVPEIALTPQMLQTFSSYFGDDIAVLHSSLTLGERYDEWKRVRTGKAHLTIGTRSAVFAPCEDPGIIIIDEEQEETYKSENTPRYNAEDIAKFRCSKSGCLLLLGSATPKISSRYCAETDRYAYYVLRNRYNEMELPSVSVVDMKEELKSGNQGSISSFLRDEIATNIEHGEQSILFLNRRGANKLITCGECGYIYKCPNCSVTLTYHSVNNTLLCHYCGYRQSPGNACPDCGGKLNYVGAGTQLVEQELKELFPESGILRMDTDVISAKVTHEQLFEKFRTENIPVLIGTQMITKGLNFENVTLVGVISADQSLYTGSFHSAERTFSLITQVIGRSGRGNKPGRAVIQTFTPENEVILQAAGQDYDAFYKSEIQVRQIEDAPPFKDLLAVTVSGPAESAVISAGKYVKARLEFLLKDVEDASLLGPVPLSVVKVNNRFRYRINIKCRADAKVREAVAATVTECCTDKRFKGITFYADNDPDD